MSFSGYLIKIGNASNAFNNFISSSTYKVTKKILDLDSYRDANGLLHRTALEHSSYIIEFSVRELDDVEMEELMSLIRTGFTEPKERKLNLTFYVPEINNYAQAEVYMPDIEYPIQRIDDNHVYYKATNLKFIGY